VLSRRKRIICLPSRLVAGQARHMWPQRRYDEPNSLQLVRSPRRGLDAESELSPCRGSASV
jgi:hypothetical protein